MISVQSPIIRFENRVKESIDRNGISVTEVNLSSTNHDLTLEELTIVLKDGWKKEQKVEKNEFGKVLYFFDAWNFQFQFLIREWVENKFGKSFYISFPTTNVVYVYIPNGFFGFVTDEIILAESYNFASQMNFVYQLHKNQLSPIVYRYEDGVYTSINLHE